jgi:uncharacterized membrane protein (DUF485 family)
MHTENILQVKRERPASAVRTLRLVRGARREALPSAAFDPRAAAGRRLRALLLVLRVPSTTDSRPRPGRPSMKQSAREMLDSAAFKQMVSRRWTVSVALTSVLFVVYYGYIVLIAVDKPFMARKIGQFTTLGIPLGIGVILLSWVLTAIYVIWANQVHDVEVRRLKDDLQS